MIESFKKFIQENSNTYLAKRIKRWVFLLELKLQNYYQDERYINALKDLSKDKNEILFFASELYVLMTMSEVLQSIPGAYAEVGVFQGTSAKAICAFKGTKSFHLFDTFEGLPDVSNVDRIFKKEMFKANRLQTEQRLANYENVFIHQGIFPETGTTVSNEKFAFVHLDVDLYQSTRDALSFFYPRLSPGGVIISHDYHLEGVKAAFNEFQLGSQDMLYPLPFSQVLIMKR